MNSSDGHTLDTEACIRTLLLFLANDPNRFAGCTTLQLLEVRPPPRLRIPEVPNTTAATTSGIPYQNRHGAGGADSLEMQTCRKLYFPNHLTLLRNM